MAPKSEWGFCVFYPYRFIKTNILLASFGDGKSISAKSNCALNILINSCEIGTPVRSCIGVYSIKIPTFMGHSPTIHASHNLSINYPSPFQSGIAAAHDGLANVIDTVVNMLIFYLMNCDLKVLFVVCALVPIL